MYRTPASNRLHIGIFGKRNTGKSSLINAITGQELAIVSEMAGTTTDPVSKAMEINPLGPCVLIDTAGIDDDGMVGEQRVKSTLKVLRKADVGIIVVDADSGLDTFEETLVSVFEEKKLPFFFVINKADLSSSDDLKASLKRKGWDALELSARNRTGIEELKLKILKIAPTTWAPVPLVQDIIEPGDRVVLVCPVDSAMPQGRLILPQVQVLRDILDRNATGFVTKETELAGVLASLREPPDLIITDSQVFEMVNVMVSPDVPLTSFSTIYARHKGDINAYVQGAYAVDGLRDDDRVLIAEACTHHVQPTDIGRVKIPKWLREYTGKRIGFSVCAGGDYPDDLESFKLIIHCGGCMVNRREVLARVEKAKIAGVPITNYGIFIAHVFGILERILAPLRGGVVKIVDKSESTR